MRNHQPQRNALCIVSVKLKKTLVTLCQLSSWRRAIKIKCNKLYENSASERSRVRDTVLRSCSAADLLQCLSEVGSQQGKKQLHSLGFSAWWSQNKTVSGLLCGQHRVRIPSSGSGSSTPGLSGPPFKHTPPRPLLLLSTLQHKPSRYGAASRFHTIAPGSHAARLQNKGAIGSAAPDNEGANHLASSFKKKAL